MTTKYGKQEAKSFALTAKNDLLKRYAQYPTALRLLGDVKGKTVLDIGCGEGAFLRDLARLKAKPFGADISKEMISLAMREEKERPLGINYLVGGPENLALKGGFDLAVSIMVLNYADGRKCLAEFFRAAFEKLIGGGKFVSIVLNPDFKGFGARVCDRRFSKEGEEILVEFFQIGIQKPYLKTHARSFSKEEYEQSAREGGFEAFRWEKVEVLEEGVNKTGAKYWENFSKMQPYAAFVAEK